MLEVVLLGLAVDAAKAFNETGNIDYRRQYVEQYEATSQVKHLCQIGICYFIFNPWFNSKTVRVIMGISHSVASAMDIFLSGWQRAHFRAITSPKTPIIPSHQSQRCLYLLNDLSDTQWNMIDVQPYGDDNIYFHSIPFSTGLYVHLKLRKVSGSLGERVRAWERLVGA